MLILKHEASTLAGKLICILTLVINTSLTTRLRLESCETGKHALCPELLVECLGSESNAVIYFLMYIICLELLSFQDHNS
jgi:hypothetical protein